MAGTVEAERRYHHGDLRAALTDAAVAQVDEVGIDHLSLRAAATTVGVSPSAAYHHFADKEALLAAVALAANASLDASMQSAVAQVGGTGAQAARARVLAAARAYLQFAIDHPRLFRAAFSGHGAAAPSAPAPSAPAPSAPAPSAPAGSSPVVNSPVEDSPALNAVDPAYHRASALLDQLVETGAVPDSFRKGAEEIIWATIHGMATLILEGYLDADRLEEYLVDMERLLMPRTSRSAR